MKLFRANDLLALWYVIVVDTSIEAASYGAAAAFQREREKRGMVGFCISSDLEIEQIGDAGFPFTTEVTSSVP